VELHQIWEWVLSLSTLALLEIVLGIDNLVIISILSEKLPEHQKSKARKIGLALALIMRILLLTTLAWLSKLSNPLFNAFGLEISIRDLVLMLGGLFLLLKAAKEIYNYAEAKDIEEQKRSEPLSTSFPVVIGTIIFFDFIFSFDSVLTAVGLAKQLWIMVTAVILAVIFMLVFVDQVCDFIERNPTIKLLALAFLIMIGVMLIAEGLHFHINRNLIYTIMAFSISTEILGMRRRRRVLQLKAKHPN
jgi:predicted tellurium resistance membrane protein TerC